MIFIERFAEPDELMLTQEQRSIYDAATSGLRGKVPAPLKAWIVSPEMAERAQALGEFVRYKTSLSPDLSELAILVTARHWTAYYEWLAHKREALKAGLSPTIILAIAEKQIPEFEDERQSLVYQLSHELHNQKKIGTELYQRAYDVLGRQALTELIGILGYYTFVAMTLNIFEIGINDEARQELGE